MSSQPSFSGSVPVSSPTAAAGSYIQPNLGHGLRIWWAFFWRNTAISFAAGAALGFAVAFLAQLNHVRLDPRVLVFGAYVLEYIVAIFVIHFIVQKKFRRFRIILTPSGAMDSTQILPPVFARTFRIWWTFAWRSILYRVALGVAMWVPLSVVGGTFTAISPVAGRLFAWIMGVATAGAVGLFTIYSNILDEDIAGIRVSLAPENTAVWPEEVMRFEPAPGSARPVA
jgi:hypothetical protein